MKRLTSRPLCSGQRLFHFATEILEEFPFIDAVVLGHGRAWSANSPPGPTESSQSACSTSRFA